MTMLLEDRLRQILDLTLTRATTMSATELVQNALRVAVLRDDPLAESWIRLELEGVSRKSSNSSEIKECHTRLAALVGTAKAEEEIRAAVEAHIARRTASPTGEDKVFAQSIGELETLYETTKALHNDPITPGMTPIDTGLASINRDKARATTTPLLLQQGTVIDRIKQSAYGYLVRVESEILRGQSVPDVIAQGRAFVDAALAKAAPDALAALQSAQDRLAQEDYESLSLAATSCRRAIKAIADWLYPPTTPITDDSGVERLMDDDRYRNRLIEYVRSNRGKSTHADLLASNIEVLGTRLKSLDDMASKGVHTKVRIAEAAACVTWTYMLAADLLRIAEELDDTV